MSSEKICIDCSLGPRSGNVAKCWVVYFGYNNPKENYTTEGIPIDTLHEERDLGVVISVVSLR